MSKAQSSSKLDTEEGRKEIVKTAKTNLGKIEEDVVGIRCSTIAAGKIPVEPSAVVT